MEKEYKVNIRLAFDVQTFEGFLLNEESGFNYDNIRLITAKLNEITPKGRILIDFSELLDLKSVYRSGSNTR